MDRTKWRLFQIRDIVSRKHIGTTGMYIFCIVKGDQTIITSSNDKWTTVAYRGSKRGYPMNGRGKVLFR